MHPLMMHPWTPSPHWTTPKPDAILLSVVEQRRRTRSIWRSALIVAFVAASFASGPAALAQDDGTEIEISGAQATVTVVVAGDISLGSAAPGAVPDWPYTCHWDEVFQETDVILGAAGTPIPGFRYWLRCVPTRAGIDPIGEFVVYNPLDPIPGIDAVTSIELAGFARAQLEPAPLLVGVSPADLQITGVETWLWPEGSTATIAQTASTNGLAVTVQARWSHTVFDVDEDGIDPIVCEAQVSWTPASDDPACSHTYLSEDADRTITATSHWDFVWWDNAAQPLPVLLETVELVEALPVAVVDLEAVISANR